MITSNQYSFNIQSLVSVFAAGDTVHDWRSCLHSDLIHQCGCFHRCHYSWCFVISVLFLGVNDSYNWSYLLEGFFFSCLSKVHCLEMLSLYFLYYFWNFPSHLLSCFTLPVSPLSRLSLISSSRFLLSFSSVFTWSPHVSLYVFVDGLAWLFNVTFWSLYMV